MPAKKKPKRGGRARPARQPAAPPAEISQPPRIPTVTVNPEIDASPLEHDGLTQKQRLFVEAMIGPAGGNATRAAELAGYKSANNHSLRQMASDTLNRPNVQRALAAAIADKLGTPEWAESRLKDLASANMANFLTVVSPGLVQIDWEKAAAAGALGQVAEYDAEKGKIKLHNPFTALETLLRIQGKLKDQTEITGAVLLIDDLTGGK
jgi:hypothetical protein